MNNSKLHKVLEVDGVDPVLVVGVVAQLEVCKPEIESKLKIDFSSVTVGKFHDFSVTQILREINFGKSRSSKPSVFSILGL